MYTKPLWTRPGPDDIIGGGDKSIVWPESDSPGGVSGNETVINIPGATACYVRPGRNNRSPG